MATELTYAFFYRRWKGGISDEHVPRRRIKNGKSCIVPSDSRNEIPLPVTSVRKTKRLPHTCWENGAYCYINVPLSSIINTSCWMVSGWNKGATCKFPYKFGGHLKKKNGRLSPSLYICQLKVLPHQ